MDDGPNVAAVAALMGEPTRASILASLNDGCARTATELAYAAGVSAQSASGHISKLLDGHLLVGSRQGRHRYYRLASSNVAKALEALQVITAARPTRHRQHGPRDEALRKARMCYDHIAGRLSVMLVDVLVERGALAVVDEDFELTATGDQLLSHFGLDIETARGRRRAFARCCLDWSERRPHLAGALGAAMASRLIELQWLSRVKDSRMLRITARGKQGFRQSFALDLAAG